VSNSRRLDGVGVPTHDEPPDDAPNREEAEQRESGPHDD
jgi:hypothetical protein